MNIDNLSKFNYIVILIFVLAIFVFLVLMGIWGINLNPSYGPPKLIQEVTVESFINNNKNSKNLNAPLFTNLIEEIAVEAFENPNDKLELLQEIKDLRLFPIDSFCETHLGKASDLEDACTRLTKDTCLETNCCVYTGLDKCVAGSKIGPTYLKNNEGIDYYYYQNKKFLKK